MIEPLGEVPGLLLHQTCIYNNHELLADLMEGPEKDNINAMDAAGRSVVYSAVSNRSFNCLKVLLENGGKKFILISFAKNTLIVFKCFEIFFVNKVIATRFL